MKNLVYKSFVCYRLTEYDRTTEVLPIVGQDIIAISNIWLSALARAEGIILNDRIYFDLCINSELRLPSGRFSTSPPSAILIRCVQLGRHLKQANCGDVFNDQCFYFLCSYENVSY